MSRTFSKAYQCSALLNHLLQDGCNHKYQSGGDERATPASSKPGFDRRISLGAAVQLARLRNKLCDYYADEGHTNPLRIVVADEGYQVDIEVPSLHLAETPWLF